MLQEADGDVTYTAEEREQIANIIVIKYESESGDGDESNPEEISVISKVEVTKATSTLLEFKLTHSVPLAVSRDPSIPDSLSISFDKKYFSDPLTEFEVNEG